VLHQRRILPSKATEQPGGSCISIRRLERLRARPEAPILEETDPVHNPRKYRFASSGALHCSTRRDIKLSRPASGGSRSRYAAITLEQVLTVRSTNPFFRFVPNRVDERRTPRERRHQLRLFRQPLRAILQSPSMSTTARRSRDRGRGAQRRLGCPNCATSSRP